MHATHQPQPNLGTYQVRALLQTISIPMAMDRAPPSCSVATSPSPRNLRQVAAMSSGRSNTLESLRCLCYRGRARCPQGPSRRCPAEWAGRPIISRLASAPQQPLETGNCGSDRSGHRARSLTRSLIQHLRFHPPPRQIGQDIHSHARISIQHGAQETTDTPSPSAANATDCAPADAVWRGIIGILANQQTNKTKQPPCLALLLRPSRPRR